MICVNGGPLPEGVPGRAEVAGPGKYIYIYIYI